MSEFYVTISGSLLQRIDDFLFNAHGAEGASFEDDFECKSLRTVVQAMIDGAQEHGEHYDLATELLSEADKQDGRASDLMRASSAAIESMMARDSTTDLKVVREALQRMVDVFGPGCADLLRGAEGDTLAHARHVLTETRTQAASVSDKAQSSEDDTQNV